MTADLSTEELVEAGRLMSTPMRWPRGTWRLETTEDGGTIAVRRGRDGVMQVAMHPDDFVALGGRYDEEKT
jgi:hypothetical protein